MELEDLVERLQSEMPQDAANRRTSDYFSDSGTSSIRYVYDANGKIDDLDKYRRAAEQERAQLKVELSQKWQEERARRAATESHVQILESQVNQVCFAVISSLAQLTRSVTTRESRVLRSLLQGSGTRDCSGRYPQKTGGGTPDQGQL
jgi:hypothetical protein